MKNYIKTNNLTEDEIKLIESVEDNISEMKVTNALDFMFDFMFENDGFEDVVIGTFNMTTGSSGLLIQRPKSRVLKIKD